MRSPPGGQGLRKALGRQAGTSRAGKLGHALEKRQDSLPPKGNMVYIFGELPIGRAEVQGATGSERAIG